MKTKHIQHAAICFLLLINIVACKKEELPAGDSEASAGNFYFNVKTHNILPSFNNNVLHSNGLDLYFFTKYSNPRNEGLNLIIKLSGKEEGTYNLMPGSAIYETYTSYYSFAGSGSTCTITRSEGRKVSGNFRLYVSADPRYSNDTIVNGSFNDVEFR